MHKIDKFLAKINSNERQRILFVIEKIISGDTTGCDIKKLIGNNLYRARVGKYRIIFRFDAGNPLIINISKRNDNTYK